MVFEINAEEESQVLDELLLSVCARVGVRILDVRLNREHRLQLLHGLEEEKWSLLYIRGGGYQTGT